MIALLVLAALGQQSPGDERPLRVALAPQDAPLYYHAQLLGDLDRAVGEKIRIVGNPMPARVNDKGQLELDVHNDGKPRTISRRDVITVTLKGENEPPKTMTAKFEVRKKEDGTWVYRNMTMMRMAIGAEQFVVVDANANGTYCDPGADGMTWEGGAWLFPFPGESERWCSATMEFTGLQFGPLGENPTVKGKPLATVNPAALPVLKGVNDERVEIGLTPRPEDPRLSADLQKHCKYMAMNNQLTHPEEKGKPGYSDEGHKAGMRSILSMGTPSDGVASGMIHTYFHRQDVIRPGTVAFGVGYEGNFGGIDGRTAMTEAPPYFWPVVCPVPGQSGVGTNFFRESPDPIPGDREAGFPITVYFGTSKLKLVSGTLRLLGQPGTPQPPPAKGQLPGTPVECYSYDPQTGASPDMTRYQMTVALIPKDPLKGNAEYEVSFQVEVDGKTWSRTWRFNTSAGKSARFRNPER